EIKATSSGKYITQYSARMDPMKIAHIVEAVDHFNVDELKFLHGYIFAKLSRQANSQMHGPMSSPEKKSDVINNSAPTIEAVPVSGDLQRRQPAEVVVNTTANLAAAEKQVKWSEVA